MPARNQRKIQPNILICLNMIMFFFLIQIWHIGRDHICYSGSRVSHIFHTVTGYLNKTWTSVNIQQIWTGSSHGFFCHMYLAHQRRSYGRQTPLFACISRILCGLNWFSFRTEKRSQTDEEMPQIYFFFFKKKLYILSDDNLCNVFVPCSLLHAFSFSLLSRSCTVALCLSFTRSLCNQIGLSYTSTALWLLAAGFICLQSGCTFQQASDCWRMKL